MGRDFSIIVFRKINKYYTLFLKRKLVVSVDLIVTGEKIESAKSYLVMPYDARADNARLRRNNLKF